MYRDEKLDGNLIKGTKQHTFDGLIGHNVGEEIEKYIFGKLNRTVDVEVANDTVCLILSGAGTYDADCLAGGVVGTGFNFGFFLNRECVVNLESGNFSNFAVTDSCRFIDGKSNNPGLQLWEKEISGAYLYQHFNYYAGKSGLEINLSSTEDLSSLAASSVTGSELAQMIFKRAASLVAVEIAAILDFLKKDHLTVIIEGSLYWKGWGFRDIVTGKLQELGVDEGAVSVVHIDESSTIGAAHLVFGL